MSPREGLPRLLTSINSWGKPLRELLSPLVSSRLSFLPSRNRSSVVIHPSLVIICRVPYIYRCHPCTSLSGAAPAEKLETNNPEDIQRQQADLQAKILSLLGSSAVVPSSGPSSSSSSSAAAATGRSLSTNYDSTPRGMTSSGGGGGGVSYPQHSYSSSSSGYHSGYGSSSLDTKNSGTYGGGGGGGEGGYGGAYNYR